MPSIFNDENQKKFRNMAEAAARAGEDSVGKVLAKGIRAGYKTVIGIIIGVIVVIGFVIGSFNYAKHLDKKKSE